MMKRILPVLLTGGLLTACTSETPFSPSTPDVVTPTITITFDDGYEGVYQYAYPILKQYNMKANVAIFTAIWSDSLSWPGYLTINQAKTLDASGWSIVSHSVNHKNLSALDIDNLRYELRSSKKMLDSLKFHGTNIFIMPYLLWNDAILSEVALVYTMSRCCTEAWWSFDTLSALPTHKTDLTWYTLTGIDVSNYDDVTLDQTYNYTTSTGRSNILMILDDVVEQNKFVDIIFHDMNAADSSDFRIIVEMLMQDKFRPYVKTYGQLKK